MNSERRIPEKATDVQGEFISVNMANSPWKLMPFVVSNHWARAESGRVSQLDGALMRSRYQR